MNNFTPRAQQVINLARREALRFHHNYIGAEHILLGLLKLGQGFAIPILNNAGVNIPALIDVIEKSLVPGTANVTNVGSLPYTQRVKRILEIAGQEAEELHHAYVGTEHLLLAILKDEDGMAHHALEQSGASYEAARKMMEESSQRGNGSEQYPEQGESNSEEEEEEDDSE